jgi:hypothetical protein
MLVATVPRPLEGVPHAVTMTLAKTAPGTVLTCFLRPRPFDVFCSCLLATSRGQLWEVKTSEPHSHGRP